MLSRHTCDEILNLAACIDKYNIIFCSEKKIVECLFF